MTLRRATLLALALTVLPGAGLTACGGDDDGDAATPTEADSGDMGSNESAGEQNTSESVDGTDDLAEAVGGEELGDALDSMGLESKAGAVETAIGDDVDRIEIDGDTMHVYLTDDATFSGTMGCSVVAAVLSEGESAVFHEGGDATECD